MSVNVFLSFILSPLPPSYAHKVPFFLNKAASSSGKKQAWFYFKDGTNLMCVWVKGGDHVHCWSKGFICAHKYVWQCVMRSDIHLPTASLSVGFLGFLFFFAFPPSRCKIQLEIYPFKINLTCQTKCSVFLGSHSLLFLLTAAALPHFNHSKIMFWQNH